jgi:hypothetical protein
MTDIRIAGDAYSPNPVRVQHSVDPKQVSLKHSVTGELSIVHDGVEPEWGIAHARAEALKLAIMAAGTDGTLSEVDRSYLTQQADFFFGYIYQEHLAVKAVSDVEEEQDDV